MLLLSLQHHILGKYDVDRVDGMYYQMLRLQLLRTLKITRRKKNPNPQIKSVSLDGDPVSWMFAKNKKKQTTNRATNLKTTRQQRQYLDCYCEFCLIVGFVVYKDFPEETTLMKSVTDRIDYRRIDLH